MFSPRRSFSRCLRLVACASLVGSMLVAAVAPTAVAATGCGARWVTPGRVVWQTSFEGAGWKSALGIDAERYTPKMSAGAPPQQCVGTQAYAVSVPGSANRSQKNGAVFRSSFTSLGITPSQDVILRYRVWFPPTMDWAGGGKLPGLGSSLAPIPPTQLIQSAGGSYQDTSWSGRIMWSGIPPKRDPATGAPYTSSGVISYFYVPFIGTKWMTPAQASAAGVPGAHRQISGGTTPRYTGSTVAWYRNDVNSQGRVTLVPGAWNTIELQYRMNTPGQKNGVHKAWLNGVLTIDEQTVVYRLRGQDAMRPNQLLMDVYYGGSLGPLTDQKIWIDDVQIVVP
jgi:hypothetical protein